MLFLSLGQLCQHNLEYTICKEILTSKNLTNLHLPRFDELKVDETLDFISACTFLKEYLHIAMLSSIGPLNYLKFDKFKLDKLNRLVKFKISLRMVIGWQKHQA